MNISLIKQAYMLCEVTHCAGRVSANTRPHQLRWGDREMGTAISYMYIECSQVAGLIQKSVETLQKHMLSCLNQNTGCEECMESLEASRDTFGTFVFRLFE